MTSQNRNIRKIFIATVCFVFILCIYSYTKINSLIKSSSLVNHTTEVALQLEKVIGSLKDAETGHRGYLLTHDSIFLEPFNQGLEDYDRNLLAVQKLVADNPAQKKELEKVEALARNREAYMFHMLEIDKIREPSPAELLVGKKIMDSLRVEVNEMIRREESLLDTRADDLYEHTIMVPVTFLIFSLIALTILFICYWLLNRSLIEAQKLKTRNIKLMVDTEKQKEIQHIFKQAPVCIIIFKGKNYIVESINDVGLEMWGKSYDEIVNKPCFEVIPEIKEYSEPIYKRVMETGEEVLDNEVKLQFMRHGKPYTGYFNLMRQPLRNINGIIEGIILIAIDVTEGVMAKRSIEKLSESLEAMVIERTEALEHKNIELFKTNSELTHQKEFSETILNTTPDLITAYDTEMRIISFNKACEDALQLKKEDVLGKTYVEAFPEGENSQGHKDIARALLGDTVHNNFIKSEVTGRFYENFIKPLTDSSGNLYAAVSIAHDTTETILFNEKIKKANEELNQSTDRFLKIFDSNPIPMTITEIKTNKIRYANKLFFDSFGYSEAEVIGSTSKELRLLSPEETQRVTAILFTILQETRSVEEIQSLSIEETEELLIKIRQSDVLKNLEVTYTRKNGQTFPAELSFEILRFGNERYSITSYLDVTERRKAKELLTRQNEELMKANKELESFNYISSHDLQEPLRQIQNFASRIADDEAKNLSEKGKLYFDKMNNAANRMQTLIADLLAYSRTKTSERKFEMTDLKAIVEDVTYELKEIIEEKNATIEVSQLYDAYVIPFQFRQMMQNLIGNSLKFSKPGVDPYIVIKNKIVKSDMVSGAEEYCHISVSDNGIGFEPQYRDRIFEVFQRLHDKQKIAGTGIGLAIVKKIVENHNGYITATGEPDKGATFNIYIPVNPIH